MYTKKSLLNLSIGIAFSAMVSSPVWADELNPDVTDAPDTKSRVGGGTHHAPYQPPVAGAPTRRIGGGTRGVRGLRGAGTELPTLTALVPETTAHTLNNQPSLYWYVSGSTENPVKFTLIYANPLDMGADVQPVLETDLEKPLTGIQFVDLSKHNVELKVGTEYEWSVAIAMGEEQGSSDIITSGTIKRVEKSPELLEKINSAKEMELPSIYAESGLWYDAIASLSNLIEKYPDDKTLRDYRKSLLEQVGLKDIVE